MEFSVTIHFRSRSGKDSAEQSDLIGIHYRGLPSDVSGRLATEESFIYKAYRKDFYHHVDFGRHGI